MILDSRNSKYAKVSALPADAVRWTDGVWGDTTEMCRKAMIPQLKHMFDDKDISHVVWNFRICAGEVDGEHDGTVFGDGDFYKWMEAFLYAAILGDNENFEVLDTYIDLISRAQQADGYLSTKQIIGEKRSNGIKRMGDVNDFEVYNFGHLFTCACLHYRITNKTSLLDVAEKAAVYLEKIYYNAAETGEVQTAVCPSHYMGLIELYRTTGKENYLELAKLAIHLRNSVQNGTDDNQDRIPLEQHDKIIGHAVRANYLYAGVADLCSETENDEYTQMLSRVWESLMRHKIYITGGCGALYNGVSPYGNFFIDQKTHQSYGYEYQLPNITAYNETCANIGLVMWAYRMFIRNPKAEYFDVIERCMLNVNLAAVSLDGRKYFYENMLRRTKKLEYEMVWPLSRTEYITSYCCPPNLARMLTQSFEYAYCVDKNSIYVGLYGANEAKIVLENGAQFTLVQKTEYPYHGKIVFQCKDVIQEQNIILQLRIPQWVESGSIKTSDGVNKYLRKENAGTYFAVEIAELSAMELEITLDMPVRYTLSNAMVEENQNQVAIEKGPLVYCVESMDAEVDTLDDLLLYYGAEFQMIPMQIEDRMITSLEGEAYHIHRQEYSEDKLYQQLKEVSFAKTKIRLIPYFAWDNRGFGEMRIWMPFTYKRFD